VKLATVFCIVLSMQDATAELSDEIKQVLDHYNHIVSFTQSPQFILDLQIVYSCCNLVLRVVGR
jgi:hypothetical protein